MKEFLREMLRRRILPWLAVYAALGISVWLVIDRVTPAWGVPVAVRRALFVLLGVALVPLVVLTWRKRLTAAGFQSDLRPTTRPAQPHLLNRWQLGILVGGMLLGAGAMAMFLRTPELDLYSRSETNAAGRSLAVLEVASSTVDANDEHFSAGLAQALLDAAGRFGETRVVGGDSAKRALGRSSGPAEAAKLLGVDAILTSAFARNLDRIQVRANLIQASTGKSLWSRDFEGDADRIFAVHDEISMAVAEALQVRTSADSQGQRGLGTRNLQALEAYWRGISLFAIKTSQSMEAALTQFQLAARLDPGFAEAEAQIARAKLHLMTWFGQGDPPAVVADAEARIEGALAIDDRLVEAYETRAELLAVKGPATGQRNWYGEAQLALAHALRLNSSRSSTYSIGAMVAFRNRNFEDVVRAYGRAIDIDPLSPQLHVDYARILTRMQRPKESERELKQALALDPNYADAHYAAAEYYGSGGSRLDLAARYALEARRLVRDDGDRDADGFG
jgi:TolB-like protein